MVRYIDFEMIDDIALGASILGTGGGGDPYLGSLIAKNALRHGKPVTLCNLDDVKDNELFIPCSTMGAPTVSVEKSFHRGKFSWHLKQWRITSPSQHLGLFLSKSVVLTR